MCGLPGKFQFFPRLFFLSPASLMPSFVSFFSRFFSYRLGAAAAVAARNIYTAVFRMHVLQ